MASPHVAGAAALLLQAKPNTPAEAVRNILQNSADPKPKPHHDNALDNVHRQGAGMLDIYDAILSETKIEPGKLSLGESEAGPTTKTLSIENYGSSEATYDLSHEPALSTYDSTLDPKFSSESASVEFSSESVTVPAGGETTVEVTIAAGSSIADKSHYGGYVVLTSQGGQTYRVPYAGCKGDYQSIKALTLTPNGFPYLAKLTSDGEVEPQAGGASYTLKDGDFPYIRVNLDHQVRRYLMEVKDAATGKSWHRAWDLQYRSRNSSSTSFFQDIWDGRTVNGN